MNLRIASTAIAMALLTSAAGAADEDRFAKALRVQRELVAENPGSAPLWNDLGNLLVASGETAEAETSYHRALSIDSADSAARFNLALLLHESARLEEAVVEYRHLLDDDPRHAWGHYLLGSIHETRRHRKLAVAAYAAAFALDRQLLYPDVNPHIITNRHVAEALLRGDNLRAAPQAPRAFGDAARIGALLAPRNRAGDGTPTNEPASKTGDDGRVIDEDALEAVPSTNQLPTAAAPEKKNRRRRNN